MNSVNPIRTAKETQDSGFNRALKIFHDAARRVPAYKDFLKKNGIKRPELIRTSRDYAEVPPTDKQNYFTQYSLADLSWDGSLSQSTQISMSSGSTGEPFYWPRGMSQDQMSGALFRGILDRLFRADRISTLVINAFSIGSWMAGLELNSGLYWAQNTGSKVTVVSPGIEEELVVRHLRRLGPLFRQIVLVGYPPFVKDVLDKYRLEGSDPLLSKKLRILTAGESYSEAWRDLILDRIEQPGQLANVISYYGMAECGIVAHETPLSIAISRATKEEGGHSRADLVGQRFSCIYQFDPEVRYLEPSDDDILLLTSAAGLPLLRYNTRDQGGILGFEEAKSIVGSFSAEYLWDSPLVYLFGRQDLSIRFYALNIYPENIKAALEKIDTSHLVSGMFVMETKYDANMSQSVHIAIELSRGTETSDKIQGLISERIVDALRSLNSEYNKLYNAIGEEKAKPRVSLKPFGGIGYIPGKKHRWAKRA